MAFPPPSHVMMMVESPPKPEPDSAPASHASPVDNEPLEDDDDDDDVRAVDPPPPKHDGGANARHWSEEVEKMKSSLNRQETLLRMCREYGGISEDKYTPLCAEDGWAPCTPPPEGSICVFKVMLDVGVRFPMHYLYAKILRHYGIAPSQLTPNAWRYLAGFVLACDGAGVKPTPSIFRYYFKLAAVSGSKLQGWYCFTPRSTKSSRRLFSAENYGHPEGWKKFYFFLKSTSPQTAWHCPTRWGTPSHDSHNAPVLDTAAWEAIKLLDTHCKGKSLRSVLIKCDKDKLPVLPTLELALVKEETENGGPAGSTSPPPRKYRAISSIIDLPLPVPQQHQGVGMASSSSSFVTRERPVRADRSDRDRELYPSQMLMDKLFEAMQRTEEDLHRVKDELRQEKSKRVADVAQLNKELEAAKAEHTEQVAKISAEKAKSEAMARQLTEDLRVAQAKHEAEVKALNDDWANQFVEDLRKIKEKHAAEVKALNDEWQLKVTHAQHQITALRETCAMVVKTIQERLVASYPSIEPMIQTQPPGFLPLPLHQSPQASMTGVALHQTIKEEDEAKERTDGTRQTKAPNTGFPPHQAPEHP